MSIWASATIVLVAQYWLRFMVQVLAKGEARVLVLDTLWDTEQDASEFAEALSSRDLPKDSLPGRAESEIEFQKGARWVRLVSWSASSREEAQEVARRIPASASRLGKISEPRIPAEENAAK